jgi:tetratricopeptide (TPR) repeat protein
MVALLQANVDAIELMRGGMYDAAIEEFKAALTAVHCRMIQFSSYRQAWIEAQGIAFPDALTAYPAPTNEIPGIASQENSAVFPIFTKAFGVYGESDQYNADPESLGRFAGIILYNTGLAYHQLGLRHNRPGCLPVAYSYYEWSMRSLEVVANHDPSDYFVCLAAMNNIGNIHSFYFNIDDATESRSNMHRLLLQLGAVTAPATRNPYQASLDEFWLTVALFPGSNVVPVAPAA